tara:strand:- start:5450 stop:5968 length:519 start_codon:yes stop_codon:yes gene_type:complete
LAFSLFEQGEHMIGRQKILDRIADCTDPDKLKNWIANARREGAEDVEKAAFKQLISIAPSEAPGTVEHDFWQTIHAFEYVLSDERGKTTILSRTRQKVARVGVEKTLTDWALNTKKTEGFTMLLERNMPELTGEAIILRHPRKFDSDVVSAARERLHKAGVDVDLLTRENAS